LAGCTGASIREATRSPALTPEATLTVAVSATPARDPLAGSKWFLSSLYGKPTLAGTRITLEFYDGFIRGSAGCNRYDRLVIGDDVSGAQYKLAPDGSLTVPVLVITQVGCLSPEGVMDQEEAYLRALRSAAAYRLVEDRLELQDATGETILVYTRRVLSAGEPAGLAGTAWQLISVDGQAPDEGPDTVLAFLDGEWLVEHSRCEGYVSSYQTAGHNLRVDTSAWLGQVCQEKEGQGVTTLAEPSDYDLVQGRLQITMLSGRVFVYEPLPEAGRLALHDHTWSMLSTVGERWIEGEPVPLPDSHPVLEGSEITLTLKDGVASGSAGCNAYGATYSLEGASLAFVDVAATERECETPEGVMAQEQRYLADLRDVIGYRWVGSQFWLQTEDGRALVFAAQDAW
jgi:heat shock protein HslJ